MATPDDIRSDFSTGSSPSSSSSSSSNGAVGGAVIDPSLASTIIGSLQAISTQQEEIMCLLRIFVHQPPGYGALYHPNPEQKHVSMSFGAIGTGLPLLKADPAAGIQGAGWWCSSSQLRYKHTTPIKTACKQVATELAQELESRQLNREQLTTILFSVIRSSVEDLKRRIKRDSRANPLVPLILYRAGFPLLSEWSPECSADHFRAAVNAIRQYWAKLRRTILRRYIASRSMQTGGAGATDWLQDCRTLDLPQLTVSKCIDLILDFYHNSEAVNLDDSQTFGDISAQSGTEEPLDSIALSPIKGDGLSPVDTVVDVSSEKRKRGRHDGADDHLVSKVPRSQ